MKGKYPIDGKPMKPGPPVMITYLVVAARAGVGIRKAKQSSGIVFIAPDKNLLVGELTFPSCLNILSK